MKTRADKSARIDVSEYEDFFKSNYEKVFDALRTPYACTKEFALGEAYAARQDFVNLLESTHKRRIPMNVAYMKLRGFLTKLRKQLFTMSQGSLFGSNMPFKYIGFSGEMGVGKSLCATMLQRELDLRLTNSIMCNFAEPLKKMLIDYFGFEWEELHTPEGKRRYNPRWGMTNRECMQKFATEAIRNGFHNDAWVKLAELKTSKYSCLCIFDDVRFDNDASFIKTDGVVIRVMRPDIERSDHASERITGIYDDHIINDGSKNDLREKVIEMACKYKLLQLK